MAHLDLRPANLFLSSDVDGIDNVVTSSLNKWHVLLGLVQRQLRLVIGDFGHCVKLTDNKGVTEGESRYCPRELIANDDGVDLAKADMFSLGISVYELALGRKLKSNDENDNQEWHDIR